MSDPRNDPPVLGASPGHLSGPELVTGRARFVGDDPEPAGLLHLAVVTSPVARGRLRSIDVSGALVVPGVACVLTAADIPGVNQVGGIVADETLMAAHEVAFVGEPLAVVAAADPETARAAARRVVPDIEEEPPVLTIEDAVRLGSYVGPVRHIVRGDPDAAFASAPHVLSGVAESGAQEHFYLETQRCRAIPDEDGALTLYSSTQHPTEIQRMAAQVLGIPRNRVCVDVRRLGGGFGGKESQATPWACLAALVAHRTGRPAQIVLERGEDVRFTGKRHPYSSPWRIAFDDDGIVLAYEVELRSNAGAVADCSTSILERSMLHADNAYWLPAVRITGRACRTNLPPATAFRGFGAPQGVFAIESALEALAAHLGLDPLEARRRNLYREGQATPYGQPVKDVRLAALLDRVRDLSGWDRARSAAAAFNRTSTTLRRGVAVTPVKFGISFTAAFLNQAAALVHVYGDGSVSVSHGAIEMGQQVNAKIAQVAADALGVPLSAVRIESTNTRRVANMSPTAASSGADLNGAAVLDACRQIVARLRPVAAELEASAGGPVPFEQVVAQAYLRRVDLCAHGFWATPGVAFDREAGRGTPFAYYVYGAAVSVVTVDLLTGQVTVDAVTMVHDPGRSLNPAVDRGQVIGGFVQGLGWVTGEEVVVDGRGRLLSDSATTYKIPTYGDLPARVVVEMPEDDRSDRVLLRSKAIGEPPFLYGESVFFAVRDALASPGGGPSLALPATAERVLRAVRESAGGPRAAG